MLNICTSIILFNSHSSPAKQAQSFTGELETQGVSGSSLHFTAYEGQGWYSHPGLLVSVALPSVPA